MSWEIPWIKKTGNHGGFVIASVHQQRNEADITGTYMDSAYVCEEHADMIVKAVNNHDELVAIVEQIKDLLVFNAAVEKIHGMTSGHEKLLKRAEEILAKVRP